MGVYGRMKWDSPGPTITTLELFKPGDPTGFTTSTAGPETRHYGDFTRDCVLDLEDLHPFTTCLAGPGTEISAHCMEADLNEDARVDLEDVAAWQSSFAGP